MFDRVFNMPLDDTSRLDWSVVIVLPIILNKSQTKTIPHTVLKTPLTTILNTKHKTFHSGFFELEMLEIFIRAFLLK